MQKFNPIILLFLLVAIIACKSSDTAVTPNIAAEIAGSYNLTKLTKKGVAVTGGKGTATIAAVDNNNASVTLSLTVGGSTIETKSNYGVTKSGTSYTIKDGNNATIAAIANNVLSATITVYGFGGVGEDYSAEFTK